MNTSNIPFQVVKILTCNIDVFDAYCYNCEKLTPHKRLNEPKSIRIDQCTRCKMVDSDERIW